MHLVFNLCASVQIDVVLFDIENVIGTRMSENDTEVQFMQYLEVILTNMNTYILYTICSASCQILLVPSVLSICINTFHYRIAIRTLIERYQAAAMKDTLRLETYNQLCKL